jgi:hypothetical protein
MARLQLAIVDLQFLIETNPSQTPPLSAAVDKAGLY